MYVSSDTPVSHYKAIGQLVMEILNFRDLGDTVFFGCECSCSSARRISNVKSNVPQGDIYLHIKFNRDPLNNFQVRALTSSGSMGGRDANTIISHFVR